MPTTYTHDAFGRETYDILPEEIKNIVRANKKLFLVGLHGPDIFFYYKPYHFKNNPVVEFGHGMHKEMARDFFEQGIETCRTTGSKALEAYLIGFVCHYILDSCCHPFVFRYQKESGLAHGEIETNLDRYFMERDKKDPFTYHPASAICATQETADVIAMAFPEFTEKEILKSLKGMKFYCDLTVTKSEGKRQLFHKCLKLVDADKAIGCRIIENEPNPETYVSTEELIHLYDKALREVTKAIVNLHEAIKEGAPLSDRFDKNYY